MSWRKEERRAERGYHHGNLKEALLQAALGLIAEKGAAGFTFADAARQAASERAFNIMRAAAERLAALAPPGMPRPPAMMIALHIWSMAHGVASLFARGDAARRKLPMSPDELLEAEVLIYLRGLGFPTDRRSPAKSAEPPPVPPEASSGSGGPPAGPWGKPK